MYLKIQSIWKNQLAIILALAYFYFFLMIFIILYLQVKEAIQPNKRDLAAAEAECARISAESEEAGEEQRVKENQQGSAGGKGKGKSKHPEDDFMATLHQQLQETGQQVLQLQQAMRPQMPAEVFGTYVMGTLVNLTERKFKKACTDISRILKVAIQDSDEEEHARAAPPSPWQAGAIDPVLHPPPGRQEPIDTVLHPPPGKQEPIDPVLHPPSRPLPSPSSSGNRAVEEHQATNLQIIYNEWMLPFRKVTNQRTTWKHMRNRAAGMAHEQEPETRKFPNMNGGFLRKVENKKELISFISGQICKRHKTAGHKVGFERSWAIERPWVFCAEEDGVDVLMCKLCTTHKPVGVGQRLRLPNTAHCATAAREEHAAPWCSESSHVAQEGTSWWPGINGIGEAGCKWRRTQGSVLHLAP